MKTMAGRYNPPIFREVQYFRQLWLWLLLLGIAGVSLWALVQQLGVGLPFGNNPAPDFVVVILAAVFGLGFPIYFYFLRLVTEVRDDGVYVRFVPLQPRFVRIAPETITEAQSVIYRPIGEFGGWGIRYGSGGKAYNVSGNRGVRIKLTGGRSVLIGSQRPDILADAIKALPQARG